MVLPSFPKTVPRVFATVLVSAASALVVLAWLRWLPLLHFYDSVQYLSLAESLARGDGFRSIVTLLPDEIHGPVYPLLVAAVMRVTGASALTAGAAVCAVAAGVTVIPIMTLHERAWGPRRGSWFAIAAMLVMSPALAAFSSLTLEPVTCATVATAACLAVSAFGATTARAAACRAAVAGVFLGLGLATRPEAAVTGAVLVAIVGTWRRDGSRRRAALAIGFGTAGLVAIAVPYGAWLHARTGHAGLLPKARYNDHFGEIEARMVWPADIVDLAARDQRFQYALMPDHAELVKNHAFTHPGFDPRPLFPLGPPLGPRAWLVRQMRAARIVVADGVRCTLLFHPATLALFGLAVRRALRDFRRGNGPKATAKGSAPTGDGRVVILLFALAAAHLWPCIAAGFDYQSRHAALSITFALPLVAGGAGELARIFAAVVARVRRPIEGPELTRRTELLLARAVVVAFVALEVGASARLMASTMDEEGAARVEALRTMCRSALPPGARVVAAHPRCAYRAGAAAAIALPYVADDGELEDYLRATSADYLVIDDAVFRRHPSEALRRLVRRKEWPMAWRLIAETYTADGDRLRIARVR